MHAIGRYGTQNTVINYRNHLTRMTSTTMDLQMVRSCVYVNNSIGDICNSIRPQTLSRYFSLCLPLARVPSVFTFRHKF